MQPISFSISINSPKDRVWHVMLSDTTYRQWTAAFNPQGSYYEGSWYEGSKIRFIGPDENGKLGGIVSSIKESRPYEFVSIQHIGLITEDGSEDTTSDMVQDWTGALENYTYSQSEEQTTVEASLSVPDMFVGMFEEHWPKALERLKALCESDIRTPISIFAQINASIEKVWECWSTPEHITKWCQASDDWHAPKAENNLQTGGTFSTTMAAKDGSASFDFAGTYTLVEPLKTIEYSMEDGRRVWIQFRVRDNQVWVLQTFEAESENPLEMQRSGWQSILDNFKTYTEAN